MPFKPPFFPIFTVDCFRGHVLESTFMHFIFWFIVYHLLSYTRRLKRGIRIAFFHFVMSLVLEYTFWNPRLFIWLSCLLLSYPCFIIFSDSGDATQTPCIVVCFKVHVFELKFMQLILV